MSNLRYEVGTKFSVEFEIVDLDDDSCPYRVVTTVLEEDGTRPIISTWLSEYCLEEMLSVNNPEIKRKRIEADIAKLQEQLLNIK